MLLSSEKTPIRWKLGLNVTLRIMSRLPLCLGGRNKSLYKSLVFNNIVVHCFPKQNLETSESLPRILLGFSQQEKLMEQSGMMAELTGEDKSWCDDCLIRVED